MQPALNPTVSPYSNPNPDPKIVDANVLAFLMAGMSGGYCS